MADYSKALSPSFASKTFTLDKIDGIDYTSASKLNLSNINFDKAKNIEFNPVSFASGLDLTDVGWSFVTAPEDISWEVANQSQRVDIFGTNNPPMVAGSRGMRDLTLNNTLVEGFVRGVNVESKISALENLLNYKLNTSDGFVSVPAYQVWANKKAYGGMEAYYIIDKVSVKETMRDTLGYATRAYVDISFKQVPKYQVNSGIDLASKGLNQALRPLGSSIDSQANNAGSGSTGVGGAGSTGKPVSGAGAGRTPTPVLPGEEIRYQSPPP